VLNLTYDVPLAAVVFGAGAGPSTQLRSPSSRRWAQIALAAQLVAGVWMVGWMADAAHQSWQHDGPGRPKPALYGIWSVDEFAVDGVDRPPLTTDPQRWRLLVIEQPKAVGYQHMDGTFDYFRTQAAPAHTLALAAAGKPPKPAGVLAVRRPSGDRLVLEGRMDGRPTLIRLHRVDLNSFRLRGRRFHWVTEGPDIG
jgi:hypothetical protein